MLCLAISFVLSLILNPRPSTLNPGPSSLLSPRISFFARFGLQVVTEMKDCAVVGTENDAGLEGSLLGLL